MTDLLMRLQAVMPHVHTPLGVQTGMRKRTRCMPCGKPCVACPQDRATMQHLQQGLQQGEVGKLDVNNPNYVLELAVGPPAPNLVPQQPGSGAVLAGQGQNLGSGWAVVLCHSDERGDASVC